MPRIADSELAANVRNRNRQASERRRQRLAMAGKVQLLTWIPDTLRRELDSVAAARREPVSETTTALLLAGLNATTTTPLPRPKQRCWECGAVMTAGNENEPFCSDCLKPATTPAANRDTPDSDATTTPDAPPPPPVYTGVVSSRDVLMAEVGKLLNEGHTGAEVARRLNASGQRTASGAQFTSANLLRDYRAWAKRQTTNE